MLVQQNYFPSRKISCRKQSRFDREGLSTTDFSRTASLKFSSQVPLILQFVAIFFRFSSPDTIHTDSTSLEYLIDLQDGMNATSKRSLLFPSLEALNLNISRYSELTEKLKFVDPIEVSTKFILERRQNAYPTGR